MNAEKEQVVSKERPLLILVTLMLIQFLSLSIDSFLFPFFIEKGSTTIEVRVIFSVYAFSRFVGAEDLVQWVST